MIKALMARLAQRERTVEYPAKEPVLPPRFRGRPQLRAEKCSGCGSCAEACPTQAITAGPLSLDMGKCIFCGLCAEICGEGAVTFTTDYKLAASSRQDLTGPEYRLARALEKKTLALFGRSLKLRQVSAGGCNACEADVNVLNTVVFDLGRFGIQFVASPRHADGLLITGPVTKNMEYALVETYNAVPAPKIVIAVGACAVSGGLYAGHEQTAGIPPQIPVNLYVPGCPPHPMTILDGLLRLLAKI
ncbi:MAG: 4Fe-4S binding protein [Elusimicrobiales bacterium]